jgi:hypothetical protein
MGGNGQDSLSHARLVETDGSAFHGGLVGRVDEAVTPCGVGKGGEWHVLTRGQGVKKGVKLGLVRVVFDVT